MHALMLVFALIVAALMLPAQSHAKGTGLIFVSNEKTNNLIVIDPKTYQVVRTSRSAAARATCISAPTAPGCTSPAATTT